MDLNHRFDKKKGINRFKYWFKVLKIKNQMMPYHNCNSCGGSGIVSPPGNSFISSTTLQFVIFCFDIAIALTKPSKVMNFCSKYIAWNINNYDNFFDTSKIKKYFRYRIIITFSSHQISLVSILYGLKIGMVLL